MAVIGNILGRLENDSPALNGLIRRQLGLECLSRLKAIYEHGFVLNGYSEAEIDREEGASFNPKPARICDLVAKDTISETLLGAAILSCAIEESDYDLKFPEEVALVKEAQKILREESASTNKSANLLALALLLDNVRHLHMSNFSNNQKKEILNKAQNLLTSIPDNLKLKTLLATAIGKVSINND